MNGPGDYEWLRGEEARNASFHWWVWWMLHISPAFGGSSRKPTHARTHAGWILWLWRHQWGCVTQVAAVLIKERPIMIEERQNGPISDSGIWEHFCTVCNILPSLFSRPESFSIIGHHCSSSIILKNQLFIIWSFCINILPVHSCVIIIRKIKKSLCLIIEHHYF